MPEIITGRAYSLMRSILYEKIRCAAADRDVLLIIPDQFSFETDKNLYKAIGAKLFNSIKTAGISALCEKIGREYGSDASAPADDNSKLIAMYKAQSKLRGPESSLIYYGRSLLRPSFVSDCIDIVSRFSRSGASPETVRAIAETSPSGAVRLTDIAVIYDAYRKELISMGLRDNLSETAYSAELALKNGYFKGKTVFFDAFTDFSADELLLVNAVVKSADSVTFSLLYDSDARGSEQFAETTRTLEKLRKISQDCNKILTETSADGEADVSVFRHIDHNYFDHNPEKIFSNDLVKVVSAADIYEESDYIGAEISHLVSDKSNGLTYNDIAVLCGSLEEDNSIIAASCERYDIPYFVDLKTSGLDSVPGRYLVSVLDACSGKSYKTEKLLRLIKSPLSSFFFYDALDLEEFCIKWSIEGDRWKEPFIVTGERAQSHRIEDNRKRIIEPLEKFRNASADATAGEICEALYILLDELEMSKQIYSYVKTAAKNNITEAEADRSFKQVWLGIVGAIKTIYSEMKDDKISFRAFSELLTLMIGSIKLSSPPQKADCVRIGDADHSVMSGVKVLFIMQANEGKFPSDAKKSQILSSNDIKALSEKNIEIDLSPILQINSERLTLYTSLTLPSDRLYISYSLADRTGSPCAPSTLPQNMKDLFEDDISLSVSDLPLDYFCMSRKTAFYTYLEHSKDKSREIAEIRRSLELDDEYAQKLQFIDTVAMSGDERISKLYAQKVFFPRNDIDLSATRVSDYYKCPFYYFCKHGLRFSTTSKINMGHLYVGLIVHYCLEHIMSREENGVRVYDPQFVNRNDDELYELVSKFADEYVADEMGGSYSKDLAFESTLQRLKKSTTYIAINFRDELKGSLFLPAAFEFDLTNKNKEPILTVPIDDETYINIRGSIDRVDLYKAESNVWVRIVDYKTGDQEFKKSEVYHGLDLQMLIYLLAVTSAESSLGSDLLPAGIMYSHLKSVKPDLSPFEVEMMEKDGILEEKLRLVRAGNYKPDGVMCGDEISAALNNSDNGIYTVFKSGKGENSGNAPVSTEEVIAMEEFALQKVVNMAERLKDGDIKADPIRTFGKNNYEKIPCTYCDFRPMCKNASPLEPRTAWSEDSKLFDSAISEMIESGS